MSVSETGLSREREGERERGSESEERGDRGSPQVMHLEIHLLSFLGVFSEFTHTQRHRHTPLQAIAVPGAQSLTAQVCM